MRISSINDILSKRAIPEKNTGSSNIKNQSILQKTKEKKLKIFTQSQIDELQPTNDPDQNMIMKPPESQDLINGDLRLKLGTKDVSGGLVKENIENFLAFNLGKLKELSDSNL